jgi:uncharacterized membrane protein (DUF485 family)
MAILISFLELLLYLAIIILIAFAIKWLITGFLGWPIEPNVYKWAQIVVGLLCIIAIVVWLAGVVGGGPGLLPHFWVYR